MRAICPKCGAKLHPHDEDFANQRSAQVRCWMCTSMVSLDLPAVDSGPPTITVESPRKSRASIMVALKSQTTTLALPRDKVVKILVTAGLSQGTECELSRPLVTIGRLGGAADIKIDDPAVSGLHCAIEVRHEAVFLHDLHSRNGTYLDDSRVVATRLEETSKFRIGSSLLQVAVFSKTDGKPCSLSYESPGGV
jgi:pSer/pThr/pTyr-binding forkhead associated (FHA) protein